MELSPLNSTPPAVYVATSTSRSGPTSSSGASSETESASAVKPTSTSANANQEAARLEAMAQEIQRLAQRDREVRAHEQAHAAAGGQYAGAPALEYTRGPNGVNYATSGHVSIDASAIPGDPEATLQKAIIVQRAAMAPAEPSSQDRQVAARASQMAAQARAEIARSRAEEVQQSAQSDSVTGGSEKSADTTEAVEAIESPASGSLAFDRPEVSQ